MQSFNRQSVFLAFILMLLPLSWIPAQAQDFTPEEVTKLKALLRYIRVETGEINGVKGSHPVASWQVGSP